MSPLRAVSYTISNLTIIERVSSIYVAQWGVYGRVTLQEGSGGNVPEQTLHNT